MARAGSKREYGNESISSLKGADRVRKRPGVIFGSDGLEGCQHAVFEILSNAIDEAREGFGNLIVLTSYADHSIEVEDFGRGCPVDFNQTENRYNWELVFCELYAGGKYDNNAGEHYEYSLGLNGLGSCATQYASEYMDVTVFRDQMKYTLHFEQGETVRLVKQNCCFHQPFWMISQRREGMKEKNCWFDSRANSSQIFCHDSGFNGLQSSPLDTFGKLSQCVVLI
jgi:DNA gyrase subunit B